MRLSTPFALGAILTSSAFGQTLVKDINPIFSNSGSSTTQSVVIGTTAYFVANDGIVGPALWKTDGTAAGTVLVKDVNTASTTSSGITNLTAFGSILVFGGDDGSATTGVELWKSDGTAAGTVLAADINTGTVSSSPSLFTVLGSSVYFSATTAAAGAELWSFDGTTAALVKDINAGATGSSMLAMVNAGGTLYFRATDVAAGSELWKSDGTTAGTVMVADINAGSASSTPTTITAFGSKVVFAATTAAGGQEPWVSDGTAGGTFQLADLVVGTTGSTPTPFIVNGSKAYFSAFVSATTGRELYVTDGTSLGTTLVLDINPGTASGVSSTSSGWAAFGTGLLFLGITPANGTETWFSDGTAANTYLVKDVNPGTGSSSAFPIFTSGPVCYMQSSDGVGSWELWKTDGTSAGTVLVKEIYPGTTGSFPTNFAQLGANVIFAATDPSFGSELFLTDGTTAGTNLIKDINTTGGTGSSSTPTGLTTFNGKGYFSANDGVNGTELWVSDGTTAGTTLFLDINAGSASSSPANFTVALGKLWFTATTAAAGIELWSTDGTVAGTTQLGDLNAGTASASPANLTALGSKIFFTATTAANGNELWVTDGTFAGTQLLEIETGTSGSSPANLTVVGSQVMFSASTVALGREPYKSDGTVAGTSLIVDLFVGTSSGMTSTTNSPTASMNGYLYFAGNNGATGTELFRTDGTAVGTALVFEWRVGTAGTLPYPMTVMGGNLYIEADDGVAGYEMWKSDGVPAGSTTLLKDINPGSAASLVFYPRVAVGNKLYFRANDGLTGTELWVTDGTGAGTVQVKDINPGASSGFNASIFQLHRLGQGDLTFFAATDGTTGTELWTSDGTAAGTTSVGDLLPGTGSGVATSFSWTIVGDNVLFAGASGPSGTELFSVSLAQLGVSEAVNFGTRCAGTGTPTIGTSGGSPFAGNSSFAVTLSNAAASAPAALFLNNALGNLPIGSCTIYPSLFPEIKVDTFTNAGGSASVPLAIPAGTWNWGIQLYFQYVVIDIGGPILGLASTSDALRIRIGRS